MTLDLFNLKAKTAVVFGGTSGIGKSIGLGMMEAGADVVPISRDKVKVSSMLAELKKQGKKSVEVIADVTKKDDVQRAFDTVMNAFGKVDILVNCAGTHLKKNTLEVTEDEWNYVMNVNLKGTLFTCQVFGAQMIKQRDGRIVNIASLGAHIALSEATAYCASKAAVLLLTRCLAVEWARYNVRVNAITPGVFRTPLNAKVLAIPERMERIIHNTPFGRVGKPDELVGAAIYLASDASSFVSGTTITVDGGFSAWGI